MCKNKWYSDCVLSDISLYLSLAESKIMAQSRVSATHSQRFAEYAAINDRIAMLCISIPKKSNMAPREESCTPSMLQCGAGGMDG